MNAHLPPGNPPREIAVVQTAGLGDLVLCSSLIAALCRAWPSANLTLICRGALAPLCDLFPSRPSRVVTVDFNPYAQIFPGDRGGPLAKLIEEMGVAPLDLLVAAAFKLTWFDHFLAAALHPNRALCTAGSDSMTRTARFQLADLCGGFDVDAESAIFDYAPSEGKELPRYGELARACGGADVPAPRWVLPDSAGSSADARLRELGLKANEFVVCFPFTTPELPLKCWPEDRFAGVLGSVAVRFGLPVLLADQRTREADLRRLAAAATNRGVRAVTFAGTPAELPVLAGVVSKARAYLGNDTGAAHLAQAYGVPGVAVFGGGVGAEAYAPWGPGSTGIIHPLPCFGCLWDCAFEKAHCLNLVEESVVTAEIARCLENGAGPPRMRVVDGASVRDRAIIDGAAQRYRTVRAELTELQAVAHEINREAVARAGQIELVSHEAERRAAAMRDSTRVLSEVESLRSALEEVAAEAAKREAGMIELTAAVKARSEENSELRRILGTIQQEADKRLDGMKQLTEALAARMHEIEDLRRQLAVISEEAAKRERGMMDLTIALHDRERTIDELRNSIALSSHKK